MLTIAATIVVLSVLILVHELGHLIAAKAVDMQVLRFSLGFGPKIAGFRKGETEYVLSAVPLGGYVSVAGVAGEEAAGVLEGGAEEREPSGRDFEAKPLWARTIFVTAGVFMNFLFAILVFAALGLYSGQLPDPTTQVAVLDAQESPENADALAQIPSGAEITAVGETAVETRIEIDETLFEAPAGPVTLRFDDISPVTLNLPAGDSARAALIGSLQPYFEPVIGRVAPGTPAAEGGLRAGDRVVAAAGEPIGSWPELVETIRARPGESLAVVVQRDDQRLSLTVTPETEQDPVLGEIGRLGIGLRSPLGPGEALIYGLRQTWEVSALIVGFLGDLFTGDQSPREVGSILTIGEVSGQMARLGLEPFLSFMALFSINLAVLNLLPIPVLDGGYLLFLGIEAVRGRPLSVEQRLRLSHVGLVIVVGIMVWAMTNDVLRVLGI